MIRFEDISAAIHVRHLQVEIAEALTFERADRAGLAADALAARGFDQAPVVEGDRVIGLVRVAALQWLMESPCLFVLDGRRITGFFRSLARLVELDTLLRDLLRRLEGAETWDLTVRT